MEQRSGPNEKGVGEERVDDRFKVLTKVIPGLFQTRGQDTGVCRGHEEEGT